MRCLFFISNVLTQLEILTAHFNGDGISTSYIILFFQPLLLTKLMILLNTMSHTRKSLQNNRLDTDIQRIAYSFNFPLNLFLTSKYCLHENNLYSSGLKYIFFALCLTCFMSVLCFLRMFTVEDAKVKKTQYQYDIFSLSTIVNFFSCFIGFTLIFGLDLIHRNNNVLLILNLQNIYRSIDFSKSIQDFIVWNWISTTINTCVHIFINALYYGPLMISDVGFILDAICDLMCIPLDLNFVIAIRIIILLKKYLDEWIKKVLKITEEQNNDEKCFELIRTYGKILNTYNLYTKIFQMLVCTTT